MKDVEIKFGLNANKKSGSAIIYLMATVAPNQRIKISTKMSVDVKEWDDKKKRCIIRKDHPEEKKKRYERINDRLGFIDYAYNLRDPLTYGDFLEEEELRKHYAQVQKEELQSFIDECLEDDKKIDIDELLKARTTPTQFFQEYIDSMPSRIVKSTRTFTNPRTIIHHQTILKRYQKFLTDMRLPDSFSIFDENFEQKFECWALQKSEYKYKYNSIPATFSVMKVWLKQAEKKGLITDDSFHAWQSKGTDVDNIYLTDDEIERLYQLDIPKLKEEKKIDAKGLYEITRDLFVLACELALRFSDWKSLNNAVWDIENRKVTIFTSKTSAMPTIPLSQRALSIYKKYNGNFPRPIDKRHSIRHLQHLGMLAGINDEGLIKENRGGKIETKKYLKYQLIKNHTARRSFATNMFLKGFAPILIMKFTNHKTEENFLKYIKISKEQAAEIAVQRMREEEARLEKEIRGE